VGYAFAAAPDGRPGREEFRNWFEFAIPLLTSDILVSASLKLDEERHGHQGGPLSFSVYQLTQRPLAFTDVVTTNPIGSTNTDDTATNRTIAILLNASALSAITAAQGGSIFIGGISSGENSTWTAYDFGGSQWAPNATELELTTSAADVPEPSTLVLLGSPMVILAGVRCRARSRRSQR
jgi:hypothetical protein